jgi:hypothetical protein
MVLNSISSESVEQNIVYVLSIISAVIDSYLPLDQKAESSRKVYEMLHNWLLTDIPDTIQSPIMDLIFNFFSG